MKYVLQMIISLWSRFYTYRTSQKLKGFGNYLYTFWISQFLGSVGEKSIIQYPLRLQGGGGRSINIGDKTVIHANCILGSWKQYKKKEYNPQIIIGKNCSIGDFCHITAVNKIKIGNSLLTGRFVYIGDNAHGGLSWEEANIPPAHRELKSKGDIVIGDNVWIGDKVTILGGVKIGDNVIIGANSVVTHDIPSNSISSGTPAIIIKQLK